MNCHDIAEILDNRHVGRLDAAGQAEAEDHLSGCMDCARDWRLHGEFAALPDLDMPPGFAASCRGRLAVDARSSGGGRKRARLVLIGSLAALAAAAALLTSSLAGRPEKTAAKTAVIADEVPALVDSVPVSSAVSPAISGATAKAATVAAPSAPESSRRTVRVLPLQNQAKDAPNRAAIESFHTALLEQLRALPGLLLIDSDAAGIAPEAPTDFRLAVTGDGPVMGKDFMANVVFETLQSGAVPTTTALAYAGDLVATCTPTATGELACSDPVSLAGSVTRALRTMALPPDPALRQQMQSRLIDRTLDHARRLAALNELHMSRFNAGAVDPLRDPATVAGAISLAASATDPLVRAEVWNLMRESRSTELIAPLIAATSDVDSDVRVAATGALASGHMGDPRVRAALERIASDDARPLVRALAVRGMAGEQAWKQHVAASLKDASRPESERVEALLYHFWALRAAPLPFLREILKDDEMIAALAETLPKSAGPYVEGRNSLLSVLIGAVEHSALGAMVAEGMRRDKGERRTDWVMAAGWLLKRGSDVRVLAALEEVANESADSYPRNTARNLLESRKEAEAPRQ